MRLFCSCGSLIINGKCSNKNCTTTEVGLDILDLSNKINSYCVNEKITQRIKQFDGFFPISSKYDSLLKTTDDNEIDNKINSCVLLRELKALKIPYCNSFCVDYEGSDDLVFFKVKECSMKEARGKINRIMPYVVSLTLYFPSHDNYNVLFLGSFNEEKWHILSNHNIIDQDKIIDMVTLSIAYQYTLFKSWSVYIKDDDDIVGMRLMVGTKEAKEIFKLRDIEDGKKDAPL